MKKKAFTLVELLIVIGIICMLAAIIVGGFGGGCAGPNGSLPEPVPGMPNVYRVNLWDTWNQAQNLEDVLIQFQASHPDLEITGTQKVNDINTHRYLIYTRKKEQK